MIRKDKKTINISTDSLEKIRKGLYVGSLSLYAVSLASVIKPSLLPIDVPIATTMVNIGMLSTLGFTIVLSKKKKVNISSFPEYIDNKKMYDQFLDDYCKMAKQYGLNAPFEYYTLFKKSLYDGYLSMDKEFNYDLDNIILDVRDMNGLHCMTGKGVCRHISPLFTDTLRNESVNAATVRVESNCGNYESEHRYKNKLDYYFKKITSKKDKDLYWGDHVVNVIEYNDEVYVIDPTSDIVFFDKQNNNLYYDALSAAMTIVKAPKKLNYEFNPSEETLGVLKLPLKGPDDYYQTYPVISKRIDDNRDILERFYTEHKDLYGEVTDNLKTLRKKREEKRKNISFRI